MTTLHLFYCSIHFTFFHT